MVWDKHEYDNDYYDDFFYEMENKKEEKEDKEALYFDLPFELKMRKLKETQ